MTEGQLKEKIKASNIGGAYVFAGEEDYLKRYYLSSMAKIASEDEAFDVFNYVSFDGGEVDFGALADAIKSPPMMSEVKLIVWRYPEIDKMREKEREAMEQIAALVREYPYACVVFYASSDGFDAGTVTRPSKLAVRLSKSFEVINFEKSRDPELIRWLKRHFDAEGIGVDGATLAALIERSGHSMQVLKKEVEKLSAYAKANSKERIGIAEVAEVASPTVECEAFALSDAVTKKDREKAFLALTDMRLRRVDAGAALAALARAVSELLTVAVMLDEGRDAAYMESALKWKSGRVKLYIASAKRWGLDRLSYALGRLRELDAKSKFGGISGFEPIEMFISEML